MILAVHTADEQEAIEAGGGADVGLEEAQTLQCLERVGHRYLDTVAGYWYIHPPGC